MSSARILFAISLILALAALILPEFGSLIFVALPSAVAGTLLWVWSLFRRRIRRRWIVVDGSNVMHWLDGTPRMEPVISLLKELSTRGFTPGVVFDANVGYKLEGRYMGERKLARRLGLPLDRVHVVPKGTPADLFILRSARGLGAQIVTNDRYRDWGLSGSGAARSADPGQLPRRKTEAGRDTNMEGQGRRGALVHRLQTTPPPLPSAPFPPIRAGVEQAGSVWGF